MRLIFSQIQGGAAEYEFNSLKRICNILDVLLFALPSLTPQSIVASTYSI